jgi:hypothetical protein
MPPSLSALNGTPASRAAAAQAVDQVLRLGRQCFEKAGLA